jgi:two-component system nitrogen regulation response regulator NtrX
MFPFWRKKNSDFQILIVDDEKDFLSSLSLWFKSQGYSVESSDSGEEALKLLKKRKPSIIFLDAFMPGMDGIETLKCIREILPHVPVVMLTKETPEDMCARAFMFGVNGFFEKTLDFYKAEHIINSLARVVSRERH